MDEPVVARSAAVADIDWSTWSPRDVATLLFVVRDGRILLIRKKRGLGAGKINGPGGRTQDGESPEACAVRETEEELRITPRGLRFAGESSFQFVDGYSIHVHVFTAPGFEGEPTETDEAIPMWVPVSAIPYDEMWADDDLWLPHVLAGRRFRGRFVFDGERMLDHDVIVEERPRSS
jgi:8-oxo-dGTP diphosphatase